jgi:hypothetical protein
MNHRLESESELAQEKKAVIDAAIRYVEYFFPPDPIPADIEPDNPGLNLIRAVQLLTKAQADALLSCETPRFED